MWHKFVCGVLCSAMLSLKLQDLFSCLLCHVRNLEVTPAGRPFLKEVQFGPAQTQIAIGVIVKARSGQPPQPCCLCLVLQIALERDFSLHKTFTKGFWYQFIPGCSRPVMAVTKKLKMHTHILTIYMYICVYVCEIYLVFIYVIYKNVCIYMCDFFSHILYINT